MAQGGTLILCRFITLLWYGWKGRMAYQRSLHDLRDLDDSLLRDIGLTRADQTRGYPEL
jgi:uncharacterized protein YjiS (DUF1127 family)